MAAMIGNRAAGVAATAAVSRLSRSSTVLFVCDIQEKFRPLIHNMKRTIYQTKLLYDATRVMNIPCVVTEHYSRALGNTVPELGISPNRQTVVFEKKLFSMIIPEVTSHLQSLGKENKPTKVLLCGLEGHVCILQTVMDLLAQDIAVHIVCDAISSQRPYDRSCALTRAISMGAVPTTTESALFELMESAEYEHFKTISGMIKAHNSWVQTEAPDTEFV